MTADLVVDCSAIMGLCFDDEYCEFHAELLDHLKINNAHVPSIWSAEVSNVLLVAERRGRITANDTSQFFHLLAELKIHVVDVVDLKNAANILPVARQYGLSYYDAQYLYLAIHHGYGLATLDGTLQKAAKRAGVPLVGR